MLIPTKKQWKSWSLPSKLTAIGTFAGLIGLVLTIIAMLPKSSNDLASATIVNTSSNWKSNTLSAKDLVGRSGRPQNLPADILDVITPGVNLAFVNDLLGTPNREYETEKAIVYQYFFENSSLAVLSTDKKASDAVSVEAKEGSHITGFRFPKVGAIDLSFQVGVTTWDDVLRDLPHAITRLTDWTARWTRIYISDYFGYDGNYLTVIVGGRCDLPTVKPTNPEKRDEYGFDEEPVTITSGGDKKITYLMLSSIQDLGEYDFIPTNFSCGRE